MVRLNIKHCIVLVVSWIIVPFAVLAEETEIEDDLIRNDLSYKYVLDTPLIEIAKDKELLKKLVKTGKQKFAISCASCHGHNLKGGYGVPDLTDKDWLWGGKLEDIYYTIKFGIRSDIEKTHESQMPPFGEYGFITPEEVEAVALYERFLSHGEENYPPEGKQVFTEYCVECHLENGEGDPEYGAPRLNDKVTLYGDSLETLIETITYGRQGIMPHFVGTLDEYTLKQLTFFVHSAGGGETHID